MTGQPDDERIRAILEHADPNILRVTLYHLTGDPELAAIEAMPAPPGGLLTYAIPPEHHAGIRRKAFDYLVRHRGDDAGPPRLDDATLRRTMELFGHGPLSDNQFRVGIEEAAFADFPRDVQWSRRPSPEALADIHVVVVGAGISGIAAAIHLERLGLRYTVIERQSDLGGTWNFNRYPEVRVDSTSLIYQYKFEKRYPWTEYFSSGGETKTYLRHCAAKYGIESRIVYDTEVVAGAWDQTASRWTLTLQAPDREPRTIDASFVISASGLFSTPKLPDIPGIESFGGRIVHTTQWDPGFDIAGRRIAQIGTGASGLQLMPYLARHAASVAVFQRTPSWVLPLKPYRDALTEETGWLLAHFPLYWNWHSYAMYYHNSLFEGLQELDPAWRAAGGTINKRNDELRTNVTAFIRAKLASRPDLIEKVTPDFPPMARRSTVDNGWYDALLRDNVELVTDGIDRIEPGAIVSRAGTAYPCDLIVCAVGYATTRYLWPTTYVGRDGATPEALWAKDGPRAYLGMTMPGLPNLFMFYGPASQGRSGSFHSMAEVWTRYALKAIVHVIESGARSIECTSEAFDRYNAALDEENSKLLWETYGQGFYYLTEQGRSFVNSPWPGADYHAMLFEPDYDDFVTG